MFIKRKKHTFLTALQAKIEAYPLKKKGSNKNTINFKNLIKQG